MIPSRQRGLQRSGGVSLLVALCVAIPALPAVAAGGELTQVAAPDRGSSNPTFFATNRRQAITEGGRQVVVYDPHGAGQQISWRDPGGSWKTITRGATSIGALPVDTTKGDRAASMVIERDSAGAEHAWVAWAAQDFQYAVGVQMVRLSELDDPSGPLVGPVTTVQSAGLGNAGADLEFEGRSGIISWLRRTGSSSYQVSVARFSDLDTDTPTLEHSTIFSTSSSSSIGTLVRTGSGMALVVRKSGYLKVFRHSSGAPLGSWTEGSGAVSVSGGARPSAVLLDSGDILAAVESQTSKNKVKVLRYSPAGGVTTELSVTGYEEPSLATDGTRAWVVMVRPGDDSVVTRQRSAGTWSSDRVELTKADGGDWAWPNAVRTVESGLLRFVVDGPRCTCSTSKNAVYAYQRAL